ncbi:cytochrome P450 [Patellaria atrata CBS 101060]|uniref:Cytochrome P450 n=1 Tax=Patellaria atrata CBS 101060 TaxID=1346257 RepID=A0A9P4SCB8_9PEZI|nr:cytochrome P450 [Patellaria atrata CBS 101060]
MDALSTHPYLVSVALVIAFSIVRFLYRGYRIRRQFKNLPGPPHHPIWGHILVFADVQETLPPRIHPHILPHFIQQKYDLPPLFYLDFWPFGPNLCIIMSPTLINQAVVAPSLPKHEQVPLYVNPLAGKKALISLEGKEWKKWRGIFNPGFSISNMMSLVPSIVDESLVFVSVLESLADSGELFRLDERVTRLTIDVICRVVLTRRDHRSNSQIAENEIVSSFRALVDSQPDAQTINIFHLYDPRRPIKQWYYSGRLKSHLTRLLEERFVTRRTTNKKGGPKYVIDLALESYFAQKQAAKSNGFVDKDTEGQDKMLDDTFMEYAISQIRIFLFAGHDTTASGICYAFHFLSRHPQKLAKIRQEHDKVFGTNPSDAAAMIKELPQKLNDLPYTLAVIKEALRLYPPGSSVRAGVPGHFIVDPDNGEKYPTDGFLVWDQHLGMHRSAELWGPTVHEFIPERFLNTNSSGQQYPNPKNAWRPFSKGPRDCIGQEMALLESKIVLVLTLRSFDFTTVFDRNEITKIKPDGTEWAGRWKSKPNGIETLWDDPCYAVMLTTSHPRDGMPTKATKRTLG